MEVVDGEGGVDGVGGKGGGVIEGLNAEDGWVSDICWG